MPTVDDILNDLVKLRNVRIAANRAYREALYSAHVDAGLSVNDIANGLRITSKSVRYTIAAVARAQNE